MAQKTKAYIALGIVCFFWGTTYIAMRTGAQHMPGLMMAAIRQLTAGVLLVSFFLVKGHRIPDKKTLLRLGLIGTLILGMGNGLVSWGEQTVPAGLTSILAALTPICMAVFSLLLIRGARLNTTVILGLLLGFAGIFVIFYPLLSQPLHAGFAFGAMIILLGMLGWSSGSVYASRQKFSLNIIYASGWEMLLAGIVLTVASVLSGHTIPLSEVVAGGWFSIAYLVAFGSLLTFCAYQYALKSLPVTLVSVYSYINPIVAIFLGWALLDEHLNWYILAGAVITLAGVYLVQRSSPGAKRSADHALPAPEQHEHGSSAERHDGVQGTREALKRKRQPAPQNERA